MALWKIKRMTIENGEQHGNDWVALCDLVDKDTGTLGHFPVPFAQSDLALNPDYILDALVTEGYTPNDWGGV
jgi:hypothetical protein